MNKTIEYLKSHKEDFLKDLFDFLRIPSVSANPAHKEDMMKTVEFLAAKMKIAGAENIEIFPTAGHPVLYADKIIDPELPTIMVYGHYDVQPADPIELWLTEPFEPVIKKTEIHPEGAIFCRGACDDKGQMYMHMAAFQGMMETNELPCNVKFMFEGEEEIGSEHLGQFCKEYTEKLKCDVILIADTSIIDNDTPSITTGLRGLSYVEVEVTGPKIDLHSGVYGGAVANPVNVLSRMIASLHDENFHINIPGFYDDVKIFSEEEREMINKAPFDLDEYKKGLNIKDVEGETGYTTVERTGIRPTLDVNGIWGGYTGAGTKTVLPSKAHAKISMRLVPNQDPDKITKLFADHFKNIAPDSVDVKVILHHGGKPAVTPTDSIEYKAASKAMEDAFGKAPIPYHSGGSIPIVALFEEVLGAKTVLMGFGLDTDAIHSPNEHFGLFNFYKGMETIPHYYHYFTQLKKRANA